MHLRHAALHEIIKAAGESTARAHYSDDVLPVTEDLESLVERLARGFGGSRQLVNARFDGSPGKLFPQAFGDLVAAGTGVSDAEFLAFTREAVGHLETVIQGKSGAKGGYLLFAAYDDADGHRYGVWLLRNTVGRIFRRRPGGFDVEPVEHLDTDQLAMACRIDVTRFRENPRAGSYLELLHRSESEVSAYFRDWVAAEETLSRRQLTQSLEELLGDISLPPDPDTGEVPGQARALERAYEHVRASPSRVVDIHELSQELYGSPAVLEERAQERGVELEPSFRYDAGALRQLVELRARAEGLDLRYPRAALEDGLLFVEEDPDTGRQRVVIDSEELARAVLGG